jgi:hypothetical protein
VRLSQIETAGNSSVICHLLRENGLRRSDAALRLYLQSKPQGKQKIASVIAPVRALIEGWVHVVIRMDLSVSPGLGRLQIGEVRELDHVPRKAATPATCHNQMADELR